jgi:hypothetical protein
LESWLESDSQFGVTKALIGHYVRHENEPTGCRRKRLLGFAGVHFRARAGRELATEAADFKEGGGARRVSAGARLHRQWRCGTDSI